MPGLHAVKEHSTAARQARPPADDLTVENSDQLSLALTVELEIESSRNEVRSDPQTPDPTCWKRLQPHRLPDPDRGGVKDRLRGRGPVLLSSRDRLVGQRVFRADHQYVVAAAAEVADVGRKRRVATLVARHLDVIDPHRRPVVDRTKMKHQPIRIWPAEATPVPDCVVQRALADA